MTERPPSETTTDAEQRQARLAEALRANLRRRKAAVRARDAGPEKEKG